VLPTKESARTLHACLHSVLVQSQPPHQVVLVDNGSADDTLAIAATFPVTVLRAGPERSAQRNLGWRHLRTDLVMFVDSDMVLTPDVLAAAVQAFRTDPGLGALVVPEHSFGEGFLARCRGLEKRLNLADPNAEAARVFRRDRLAEVGGYREALTACEDWDLADRIEALGCRVARISPPIWHDEGRLRLRACFAKKRYYGRWLPRYLRDRTCVRPRSLLRRQLVRRPGQLAREPLSAAGLILLKAVEASGLLVGAAEGLWDRS
jgi:glycosyltransferase involved in cell wall biosynthesis